MTPEDRKRELADALAAMPPIPIPGLRPKTPEDIEDEASFDAFIARPEVGDLLVSYAEALRDEEQHATEVWLRKQDFNPRYTFYWRDPEIDLSVLPEELQAQWRDHWEDWFREVANGIELPTGTTVPERYDALAGELERFAQQIDAEGADLEAIEHVRALLATAKAGYLAGAAAGQSAIIPPRDDWSGAPPGYYEP